MKNCTFYRIFTSKNSETERITKISKLFAKN